MSDHPSRISSFRTSNQGGRSVQRLSSTLGWVSLLVLVYDCVPWPTCRAAKAHKQVTDTRTRKSGRETFEPSGLPAFNLETFSLNLRSISLKILCNQHHLAAWSRLRGGEGWGIVIVLRGCYLRLLFCRRGNRRGLRRLVQDGGEEERWRRWRRRRCNGKGKKWRETQTCPLGACRKTRRNCGSLDGLLTVNQAIGKKYCSISIDIFCN